MANMAALASDLGVGTYDYGDVPAAPSSWAPYSPLIAIGVVLGLFGTVALVMLHGKK